MAKLRVGSLPLSLLALMSIALAGVTALDPSPKESADKPTSSSSGENELICHSSNPAECYPKIFQPTDEFQIVHPDQDIPKGLHVRLNVQTGQREAKINVPDEINPALEGLPVDSSVVIVEPEEPVQEAPSKPKIPANAPEFDPAGVIKEPRDANSKADGSAFYRSLQILKKGLDVDEALEMLEDISHDIYYGLKIAEDYHTVHQLFCLANTPSIFSSPSDTAILRRARLAALTIGSAVQNNPKALAQIEKHWPTLQDSKCPGTNEPLSTATFRLISPDSTKTSDPSLAKVRISAISGLLKNAAIRQHFLANGGMELLLQVLVNDNDDSNSNSDWEPAQEKASFLILDNFLDGDMGAALGEWPTQEQAHDKECAKRDGDDIRGDCWDWHAKQVAERFKSDKDHWSRELLSKLKARRKANGKRNGKEEL